MLVVPPVFEQARTPEAPVASAALRKFVAETPTVVCRGKSVGVPASAITITSTTVIAAGATQKFACGARSASASTAPVVAPTLIAQTHRLFAAASCVDVPVPAVMSAPTTAPNDGAPAASPCRTVVVVPKLPSAALACEPPPITS